MQVGQAADLRRQDGELIAPEVKSLQVGQVADLRGQLGYAFFR